MSCIFYTLYLDKSGYGRVWKLPHRGQFAHRLAYETAYGPIPKNMDILHSCDNRNCINPAHLRLGTQAENNKDRNDKNRQAKGEQLSKLTELNVQWIKELLALGYTQRKIAKVFGVNHSTIGCIKRNVTWRHL